MRGPVALWIQRILLVLAIVSLTLAWIKDNDSMVTNSVVFVTGGLVIGALRS